MKNFVAVVAVLISLAAIAGTIKTWTNGETLKASDLNAALSHVHTAAEATVTDSRISSSAAIAHTKLATPALLPKAWGYVDTGCAAGTCTIAASSRVTSVTWTATGVYGVKLAYVPTNVNFAVLITSKDTNAYCYASNFSTGAGEEFGVNCFTRADAATATNAGFSFLVMDDN